MPPFGGAALAGAGAGAGAALAAVAAVVFDAAAEEEEEEDEDLEAAFCSAAYLFHSDIISSRTIDGALLE